MPEACAGLLPGSGAVTGAGAPWDWLAPASGALTQCRVEKERQKVNIPTRGLVSLFLHSGACPGFAAGPKGSISKIPTGNRGFQLPAWTLQLHLPSGGREPQHRGEAEPGHPGCAQALSWETAASLPPHGGLCAQ